MQKVLVTGGAGFIGSHVVDKLVGRGLAVVVLDDLSAGLKKNLEACVDQVELVVGDLRDRSVLETCLEGVSHVLHLAALGSVSRSVRDPLTTHDVNATGTLLLLQTALLKGVERVVMASSSSVYGNQPGDDAKHEAMVPAPMSPYAVSKLVTEKYAAVYNDLQGLETVALRYFNVFGPRQRADSEYAAVIPCFIDRLLRGEKPVVFGDGEQTRDFTYVDNVVACSLQALQQPGVGGRVFNVATGRAISLNDLLTQLQTLAGRPVHAEYRSPRAGDVLHSLANNAAACAALDWRPEVDFEEGLRRTWVALGGKS